MTGTRQRKFLGPAGHISMIHVEEDCLDYPLTREILARAIDIPVTLADKDRAIMPGMSPYPKSLSEGKRHLLLTRNKGKLY